mmetsp:Transcript_6601/g.15883  ORF Transcript_6601/g.15883 Transcript_6601/m.15883 type:complete len:238 (-) Transcript_6601:175-888(-)
MLPVADHHLFAVREDGDKRVGVRELRVQLPVERENLHLVLCLLRRAPRAVHPDRRDGDPCRQLAIPSVLLDVGHGVAPAHRRRHEQSLAALRDDRAEEDRQPLGRGRGRAQRVLLAGAVAEAGQVDGDGVHAAARHERERAEVLPCLHGETRPVEEHQHHSLDRGAGAVQLNRMDWNASDVQSLPGKRLGRPHGFPGKGLQARSLGKLPEASSKKQKKKRDKIQSLRVHQKSGLSRF